eukprot:g348.t1
MVQQTRVVPSSSSPAVGGLLVGYATLRASEDREDHHDVCGRVGILFDVAISPNMRRRGLGKLLLSDMEKIARDIRGFHYIYLKTSPKLARTFYRKCGYVVRDSGEAPTTRKAVFKHIRKCGGVDRLDALFRRRQKRERETNEDANGADGHMRKDSSVRQSGEDDTGGYGKSGELSATSCDAAAPAASTIGYGKSGELSATSGDAVAPSASTIATPRKNAKRNEKRQLWLRKRLVDRYFTQSSPRLVNWNTCVTARQLDRVMMRGLGGPRGGKAGMPDRREEDRETRSTFSCRLDRYWKLLARKDLLHYRQIGPSCGICAVAIATSALEMSDAAANDPRGTNKEPVRGTTIPTSTKVEHLLKFARDHEMTYEGEIFRIDDLAVIARAVAPLHTNVSVRSTSSVDPSELIGILSNPRGGCLVIPYDAEIGNAAPGLRKGGRSHFAVIAGVAWKAIWQDRGGDDRSNASPLVIVDPVRPDAEKCNAFSSESDVAVVAIHSSSDIPVVASWRDFVRSNGQLMDETSPVSEWARSRYRIDPTRGPNLRGKCLVFSTTTE